MLSSGGRIKDLPNAQNLLENVIYNFGFKSQRLDQICFAVESTFLEWHVSQKLAFLKHLITYTWIQNIHTEVNI